MSPRLTAAILEALSALRTVDANSIRWCLSDLIKELNEAFVEELKQQQGQDSSKKDD